jgi:hypothetical protein
VVSDEGSHPRCIGRERRRNSRVRAVVLMRVLHAVDEQLVDLVGEHGRQGRAEGCAVGEACTMVHGQRGDGIGYLESG